MIRVLYAKGIITPDELRKGIEAIDNFDISKGAKIVAKAWVDLDFKEKLLLDATSLLPDAVEVPPTKYDFFLPFLSYHLKARTTRTLQSSLW